MIRHWIVPVYLFFCLVLGGASAAGFVANLVLQLAALPLIGWGLWRLGQPGSPLSRSVKALIAMAALLVLVALVQLVPLPPGLWASLPGRQAVVEGYRLLGVPLPWLPLTLTPEAALASLLWLLPAFAALFGTAVLGAFRGRAIAAVLIAVTLTGVAVGALQVIGGDGAYPYRITNHGVAVGFFANANHNATLLLVCLPFLTALQATLLKRRTSPRSTAAIRLLVVAGYAVIGVGLLLNGSLAGLALGVPVALATWLTFGRRLAAWQRVATPLALLLSAGALVLVATSSGNNLFGMQRDHVELSRQTSFALTLRAARTYLPFGSGIGSFQPVYRTQEALGEVGTTYMNHAHSDWLELLLETGLAGVALAAAFLAWWGLRARAIWAADDPDRFAQAATIATAAMLLHSVVDYPLRTAALSTLFAICLALMAGARPYVRPGRKASAARHISLG